MYRSPEPCTSLVTIETNITFLVNLELAWDINIKISNTLQNAVNKSFTGDTILLPPGEYTLSGVGGVNESGAIRGL